MSSPTPPFQNDSAPGPNTNRIRRITFNIGGIKTAAHVDNPTGSLERYDAARADSVDPQERQVAPRDRYITEED